MDPWIGKGALLAATIAMIAIRAPHGQRSRSIPVVRSARGALEAALLTFVGFGYFLPLAWIATPAFAFAEFPLRPEPFAAGVLCYVVGLWIFHRSHADLGANWSVTLEVREGHRLVTEGVYSRVRHPMYTAILLYCVGQALVVPNWVAGLSFLVAFAPLVALRLGPEERMLRERFGAEWDAYAARTKRLVPGVW